MSRILVTGAGGPAGASLACQMAALGHDVLGVDAFPPPGPTPIVRVPLADSPSFAPALLGLAGRWGADLIVPTVTEELVAPIRHQSGPCPIVIAPPGAVFRANDKWLTFCELAGAGVPVPVSELPGSRVGRGRWTRSCPGFVSKPRRGRGGRGVCLHSDHRLARTAGREWIVQEFAPGAEYAAQVFLAPPGAFGEHVVVLRKTRLKAGMVGNGVDVARLAPAACEDVARVALAAVRALGVWGPADVDVRRRADGVPVVLEVNARVGAHSAHAPEIARAIVSAFLP